MTAVDELLAFVRAQWDARCAELDEDERVANEAIHQGGIGKHGEAYWQQVDRDRTPGLIGDIVGNVVTYDEGSPSEYQAAHIARWDPARVLAEVKLERADIEAKRRILELHHPVDPCDAHDAAMATTPCETVLALAQPYAGRPGWREEWRA